MKGRISDILIAAARHLEDARVATPLCLHAKQCPEVNRRNVRRAATPTSPDKAADG